MAAVLGGVRCILHWFSSVDNWYLKNQIHDAIWRHHEWTMTLTRLHVENLEIASTCAHEWKALIFQFRNDEKYMKTLSTKESSFMMNKKVKKNNNSPCWRTIDSTRVGLGYLIHCWRSCKQNFFDINEDCLIFQSINFLPSNRHRRWSQFWVQN